MKVVVSKVRDRLRTGYWFLPGAMAAGSVALAYFMNLADRSFQGGRTGWLLAAGGPGATLLGPRLARDGATCAIARRGP